MKKILLAFAICFLVQQSIAQNRLPKKPTTSQVRSYNQININSINIGMSKEQVLDTMGGVKTIQTYMPNDYGYLHKYITIPNPYSRDIRKDSNGTIIEILWYYTDKKRESNSIDKYDLSPIVFENNLLLGVGWGFFEDYSKRKQIFLNTGNN